MPLETKQIKEVLRNCLVLIVEDDVPLANRIVQLFIDFTNRPPIVAHSMEQARKIVADTPERFGLAIMDVMLPPTDKDFEEIQELEKTLAKVRGAIEAVSTHPNDDTSKERLFDARYERAQALRQMENLLDRQGGVKLAEEWRRSYNLFPILFLTAVGDGKKARHGHPVTEEHSGWVVKPVPTYLILEKCVDLLRE